MTYRILRIEEDLDFGCEEREEDRPVMAVVTLQEEKGAVQRTRVPDQYLYDSDIKEGDAVFINEKGELQKAPGLF